MTETHKQLGKLGEDFAARWLVRHKGWKIIARNVHASGGEVDIVAYDSRQNYYILVEVKTRKNEGFALGVEAVGPKKQQRMQRAAARFFLQTLKFKEVPEFEVHAIVLLPNTKKGWLQPAFLVDYYDDLS